MICQNSVLHPTLIYSLKKGGGNFDGTSVLLYISNLLRKELESSINTLLPPQKREKERENTFLSNVPLSNKLHIYIYIYIGKKGISLKTRKKP